MGEAKGQLQVLRGGQEPHLSPQLMLPPKIMRVEGLLMKPPDSLCKPLECVMLDGCRDCHGLQILFGPIPGPFEDSYLCFVIG